VLDLPLDRMEERNTFRAAIIAAEVSRRSVENSEDTIRSSLRDDLRQTKSTLESWRIQQSAVELAARRIESTDLKLQAGRALTRDLLDAQQSLLDAKNAASVALVAYTLSRLSLFRDLELLLVDENGIETDLETLSRHLGAAEPPSSPVAGGGTEVTP
jgi:outer membrane protein TolC